MRAAAFLLVAAIGTAVTTGQAPPTQQTLRAALQAANVPSAGLPDAALDEAVTDIAVESGASITLAYRVVTEAGAPRLHVRVRHDAQGPWRATTFDDPELAGGLVAQARHAGGFVLVTLDREADLPRLLVLDQDLALKHRVEGGLLDVLPGPALLYREALEDQRPAHPLAVSLFDPMTGESTRIYPTRPWSRPRQIHIERVQRALSSWKMANCLAAGHPCDAEQFDADIASDVRTNGRGDRLAWITRFGPAESETEGPVTFRSYVLVACFRGVASGATRCEERSFGGYDGPDGRNTLGALESAFARR